MEHEGRSRRTCSQKVREQSAPLSPLTTHYILVCGPEGDAPCTLHRLCVCVGGMRGRLPRAGFNKYKLVFRLANWYVMAGQVGRTCCGRGWRGWGHSNCCIYVIGFLRFKESLWRRPTTAGRCCEYCCEKVCWTVKNLFGNMTVT